MTRDHWVEIELGPDAPTSGPLYLIANGWLHPTDSSINVALGQGHHAPPQGLSLEVPDEKGGWRVAKPGLGFPEGKIKTVVLDISHIWDTGIGYRAAGSDKDFEKNSGVTKSSDKRVSRYPRRLRLRTNLEIYWDSIAWAKGTPNSPIKKQMLPMQTAELRYRGYSHTRQANASSPEVGDYAPIAGQGQRWRDLEGFYTRFGDVKPLLDKTDDHYVIMNAGDEMALRFGALPAPAPGWKRDFVLIGDGWVKDGNFNTTFSKTVLPLPAHDLKTYNTPPGRLEDDPVYKRHPQDWQNWHTRYVSTLAFQNALRPNLPPSPPPSNRLVRAASR